MRSRISCLALRCSANIHVLLPNYSTVAEVVFHSLFHDGLEVIAEVSVECVLVEGLVDDLVRGRCIPDPRDEQHGPDRTTPPLPLTHAQVLEQHHAV